MKTANAFSKSGYKITRFFGKNFPVLLALPAICLGQVHWQQNDWCEQRNGNTEYVLPDATRISCLTQTHAIKAELAANWAASLGQSLHFSEQTHKRAGVLLIMRDESEIRFLYLLYNVVRYHRLPVDVWTINIPY